MTALERTPARPLTVEANMGLVMQVAHRFRWALGTVLEREDLINAGALGLMRALDTYEPERAALSVYATPWIRVSIQEAIDHGRRVVRVPLKAEQKMRKLGSGPPLDEHSLDEAVNDNGPTWGELLRSDSDPEGDLDTRRRLKAIAAALERLPPRVRTMVHKHFVEDLCLREIAAQSDLSPERVRQLVAIGVERIRVHLRVPLACSAGEAQ